MAPHFMERALGWVRRLAGTRPAGASNTAIPSSSTTDAGEPPRRRRRRVQPGSFRLLSLPDELLGSVMRWCTTDALLCLSGTAKRPAELCKQQAQLLLAELCAAATTRQSVVVGARTILALARMCGLRPRLPFAWAYAMTCTINQACDFRQYFDDWCAMPIDLQALELLYLVFGAVDIPEPLQHASPIRLFGISTEFFDDDHYAAFHTCLATVMPSIRPCRPFAPWNSYNHCTIELVSRILHAIRHSCHRPVSGSPCLTAQGAFRRTRRLMRTFDEDGMRARDAIEGSLEEFNFDPADDPADLDYAPSDGDESVDEEDVEPAGVIIDGVWYLEPSSYFDEELNHPAVRAAMDSADEDGSLTAHVCDEPLCCHCQCSCTLVNAFAAGYTDSELPPAQMRLYPWVRVDHHFADGQVLLAGPAHQQRFEEAMHEMAFAPRRSTSCPRLLADRQRHEDLAAWREAGRADPYGALARQGCRVVEHVPCKHVPGSWISFSRRAVSPLAPHDC